MYLMTVLVGGGRLREDEGREGEVEEGILEALQLMPTHHLQQFYTYLIGQVLHNYFSTVAHTYIFLYARWNLR